MMEVRLTAYAAKQFVRLPKLVRDRLRRRLELLNDEPMAGKKLHGQLEGFRSLRAWPYRILYFIDRQHLILWVHSIEHRQSVYKR